MQTVDENYIIHCILRKVEEKRMYLGKRMIT